MNKDIIATATTELGVTEVKGNNKHNKRILHYFNVIGHKWVQDDETAWCSAFVNYVAKICGRQMSGELHARSWLKVGEPTTNPEIGDIVVFWRDHVNSWKGHVGFFFGYNKQGTHIIVLGGNQSNQVRFSEYPVNQLLAFRKI